MDPELSNWDLLTFEAEPPAAAGAMVELFGPETTGEGERDDAIDIIPAAPSPPRFRWAAGIQGSVLKQIFDRYLDSNAFPKQGGTLNTPDNPTGYMVVPSNGKRSYSLPGRTGCVTISAPANGTVTVELTSGLTPHGRASLVVLGTSESVSTWADDKGSASVSIAAASGDRLAIAVEAISLSGDTSVVVWRPTITFQDGSLGIDFHFYKYLEHSSMDAEGDGSIVVQLTADRFARFKLSLTVANSDFQIPLWVWASAFFGGFLLSSVGATIAEISVAVLGEDYIRDRVDPQSKAGILLGPLSQNLPQPQVPGTAIFLDDLAISENGLLMSGRADAGVILSYGRKGTWTTSPGLEIEDGPFYLRIDWQPSAGPITVQLSGFATLSADDANTFWSETYDDLPLPPYPPTPTTKELSLGDSAVFYHDSDPFLTKVLIERQAINDVDVYGLPILVTWVAYRKRVVQAVRIHNDVSAIVVDSFQSLTLTSTSYRYSGALTLQCTKFFLTADTNAVGDEHWYWDGQEVPDAGLAVPGGSVRVDPDNHALLVDYDQTNLPPDQVVNPLHTVRFAGTDVFGRFQSCQYLLQTPAHTLTPNPIAELPPLRWNDPRAPLNDPIRDRLAAARAILSIAVASDPALGSIARAVMAALESGSAVLDANSAKLVLDLLGDRLRSQ